LPSCSGRALAFLGLGRPARCETAPWPGCLLRARRSILVDDLIAQSHAILADVDARASDQLVDLSLRPSAERASDRAVDPFRFAMATEHQRDRTPRLNPPDSRPLAHVSWAALLSTGPVHITFIKRALPNRTEPAICATESEGSTVPSKHSSHTLGLVLSVARRYVQRSVRGTRLQISRSVCVKCRSGAPFARGRERLLPALPGQVVALDRAGKTANHPDVRIVGGPMVVPTSSPPS
jgi:hypothetical protein